MGIMQRLGSFLKGSTPTPKAAFFQGGRNPLMVSWRPALREMSQDIQRSWADAAARAQEGIQNSGFLTRVLEVECGSVVGAGLRLACRPDYEALGWTREDAAKWGRNVENRFRAYGDNPVECDAAGKMTFGKQQQAAYASWKTFGEVLGLMPIIDRPASMSKTKMLLLPPSRLLQKTDMSSNVVQGVRTDGWGFPQSYFIGERDRVLGWNEREIAAYDADGRPNVLHIFDSSMATTRGISPLTSVLKVVRQVDQFADATLTKALIQTIFAATIKSNVPGIQAFEGLMTTGDTTGTDIDGFAAKKGEWYESAKIDMTQHGRLGHLFPGDELVFTESTSPGQQYDQFMGWLMREIAAGAGVTYESATGDFRGATYSSIRMGGAMEWLGVLRRRANIIIPFCQAWFNAWLEEEIFTGRIPFKGGYFAFLAQRAAATRCTWSGPAQPQADDFKAARSAQVLKEIQGTTLADIAASYGRDWDDDMRQRAAENALADELDLPRPWSPVTMLETKDGQDKALEDPPADAVPTPKPAGAIADELENELEISISGD